MSTSRIVTTTRYCSEQLRPCNRFIDYLRVTFEFVLRAAVVQEVIIYVLFVSCILVNKVQGQLLHSTYSIIY